MFENTLTNLLKIKYPIIQAPMAGGVTTSQLVSEVSRAGGLGMIGAGYMTPAQIKAQIREIKKLTDGFFGINLFVPNEAHTTGEKMRLAEQRLQPIRERLNIQPAERYDIPEYPEVLKTFNEQIKVVIEEEVPVCTFTFGIPPEDVIKELKNHHIILMGTATTVSEAVEVESKGLDIVVVQGSEAGGHRGHFIESTQVALIGLMSLIPQVVDNVTIPVIAAGGIMDGRGLTASLSLGAQGVQMGTAFLTCIESGANQVHKEAILQATEDELVLTRAFSGKWARGIINKFIFEMTEDELSFPDFPIQNTLTKDIRKASSNQGNKDFMSLWSGQSPRLAKNQSASTLIKSIIDEAKTISKRISSQ